MEDFESYNKKVEQVGKMLSGFINTVKRGNSNPNSAEPQATSHKLQATRGVSPLISWVILVGLAVLLGTFFFNWARGYATDVKNEMVEKGEQSSACDYMSFYVKDVCQNTQTLYMNVTNNNDLRIESFIFRLYDIHRNAEAREKNITIIPGETRSVDIVKQGIVREFEAVPAFFKDKKRLVCQGQSVRVTSIPFCS